MRNSTRASLSEYSVKGAYELKDLDLGAREVAMYVSSFDTIDSDNDMIVRGAFSKSLAERGPQASGNRQIAFLRHHDWEKQIGVPVKMEEDSKGLFVVAKLGNSTAGNDALEDYKDGVIREHSIGFKYIQDKLEFVEDKEMASGGFWKISELALWEFSAVTFGANQYTGVIDVAKGQEREDMALKLNNEIQLVTKAILNGKGTDERQYSLEMRLKYLNARMMDLAITEPIQKSHSAEPEPSDITPVFNWKSVSDHFTKDTYGGYPQSAVNNAKKGIELNEAVNNKCATDVGKQRARDIVAKRPFSLDVLKRVYSYLSRAKEYYNPNDEKACGTISYLLWGGESMRVWSEKKLAQIESNNN
jgi:HK97 family phage prohead protease